MSNTTPKNTNAKSTTVKKIVAFTAIPAALVVSGLAVAQASYSAYSATTVNPTSNWTSGTVALSDDDANTALFTASNLKPGATGSQCITVTSTGSLASTVKLYGTNYATTNDLASQISLTVVQGSGGSFGNCTNFTASTTNPTLYSGSLAGFGTGATAKTSFATGIGDWAPTGTGSESRTFKISYSLASNAPNSSQGGTAALGFTWEAQNS
ncbi:hypothetical protein FHX74_000066 [Friedmanniella endophytica]|uniref:Camelysin metallo-endopeptidase n=1 Tax=Microlunatus kandeliicorticis TaxID=1759536 RepID=A0A7W3INT4_9ACTN|nr:hypothetical protein [Microlunatus kandeliicorticis]MBA8792472.1 hypothetical protein [Microlunatus kandeliicorticis]